MPDSTRTIQFPWKDVRRSILSVGDYFYRHRNSLKRNLLAPSKNIRRREIINSIRFAAASLLSVTFPATTGFNQAAVSIEHARLIGATTLHDELLFHVQGVDLDKESIWVTSVDRANSRGYLHQFDRATGKFLRRLELTDGPRYHPGGFSLSKGSIWIPVAERAPHSSAVLVEIDADSLRIKRKIRVVDHLGCVAAQDHILIAGNWDSRKLYIIDLNGVEKTRIIPNPSSTRYQDMKFIDGKLVASGHRAWLSGAIDWIDYPSMRVMQTLSVGVTDHFTSYANQGMAIRGNEIDVLPHDGPITKLYHFRLDAKAAFARNKNDRAAASLSGRRPANPFKKGAIVTLLPTPAA